MPFVPDNNTSGFIPDNSSYSPEAQSVGFVPDKKKKNSWLDAMWSGAKIGFSDTARGVQQIAGNQ